MKRNRFKLNFFSGLILNFLFFSLIFSATAQDVAYEDIDTNQDEKVESGELREAWSTAGALADWDKDQNNYFDDSEFYILTYRLWDVDNDGIIDENEWDTGVAYIEGYDVDKFGTFDDWDSDKNSEIDADEFSSNLGETEYYSSVDANQDQKISKQEASDAVFMIWDEDNDDYVEKIEYGKWSQRLDKDDN